MCYKAAAIFLAALATVNGKRSGDSCYNEKANFFGRCRLPHECPSAQSDYENKGILPTFCEYTQTKVLVCCKPDRVWPPPTTQPLTTRPAPIPLTTGQKRISEKKCEIYSKAVVHQVEYISLILEPEEMSISDVNCNYTGIELIVGGEDALQGEFPHMAAIGWANLDGGYDFGCGGSLISDRFVMSAGHCIKRPIFGEPTIVRLGDQNLDPSVKDNAKPRDIRIKQIHKHPGYKPPQRYNDIALFELAEKVEFNDNIRPACLWTRPDFSNYDKALATGWGVINPDTQERSNELKKVSLSLLTNSYCDRLVPRNRYWDGFAPEQMCAGELRGGKDTCQGDSGSPLQVVSQENQCIFYVVGVTSFGGKCAQTGQPAVYTRVYSYLDWIEGLLWPGE